MSLEETPIVSKYAVLQEVNEDEAESWLTFIRYNGNEDELQVLQSQLQQVNWILTEGLSTFDLETNYLVSEQTAKEMTKIDLNHHSFHRKFDGKLQTVNLGFVDGDSNKKKMKKTFKLLGDGGIDNFIDKEDLDPEDIAENNVSTSETEVDDESSSSSSDEEEDNEEEKKKEKKKGRVPRVEIPSFARAKIKHRRNK